MLKKGIMLFLCLSVFLCACESHKKPHSDNFEGASTINPTIESKEVTHATAPTEISEIIIETEQAVTLETIAIEPTGKIDETVSYLETEPTECTTPIPTTAAPIETEFVELPINIEWKTAYLDFIETKTFEYCAFSLVYIDADNIPELYLNGSNEATGDSVCSYKNGKVIEIQLGRTVGGQYIERTGNLINQNGNMGCIFTDAYTLTNDGFIHTFSASMLEDSVYFENGEYYFTYTYYLGNEQITEEEYTNAVAASFSFSEAISLSENVVSYDAIVQQITDHK